MTRGIQLKQLTSTDLGLLGLPDHGLDEAPAELEPVQELALDPPRGSLAEGTAPLDLEGDPEFEWEASPGLDLAAVAREIRAGLEETLRLLQPGAAGRD
jgi:hypothetical protein